MSQTNGGWASPPLDCHPPDGQVAPANRSALRLIFGVKMLTLVVLAIAQLSPLSFQFGALIHPKIDFFSFA
ncbi:hypothetical protein H6F88_19440 [Oculatella sp. FACHB-28]|uniref:hypothetical protein n=1 Tax=Cyanophyceae TaxID=3028117 RepID=UPI001682D527|nr:MULTISPECIES: hypothetical protein [Cyanophyceae]MBD2058156.1 hypothetical protein [Oculatella sp. FACHB-28]MBD2068769.1 hypothetical protein [Leptolyngbya sp. FACHB-671]